MLAFSGGLGRGSSRLVYDTFEAHVSENVKVIFAKENTNGLFQKKSTPSRQMGFWKFSLEGGQRPGKFRREGGLNSKKSSAGVISTNSSCNLNV